MKVLFNVGISKLQQSVLLKIVTDHGGSLSNARPASIFGSKLTALDSDLTHIVVEDVTISTDILCKQLKCPVDAISDKIMVVQAKWLSDSNIAARLLDAAPYKVDHFANSIAATLPMSINCHSAASNVNKRKRIEEGDCEPSNANINSRASPMIDTSRLPILSYLRSGDWGFSEFSSDCTSRSNAEAADSCLQFGSFSPKSSVMFRLMPPSSLTHTFKKKKRIVAFDMDHTLITTKSGKVFPIDDSDWRLMYDRKSMHRVLEESNRDGETHFVMISNQGGLKKKQTKDSASETIYR